MIIQGLQKLTLLDYPGRVACTVFLGGCDFRCPFCHNSELVVNSDRNTVKSSPIEEPKEYASSQTDHLLKEEAAAKSRAMRNPYITEAGFFAFLEKRRHLLDGVAVTGGEPTLCRGLPEFLEKIHDMGFAVKLDTNGNQPDVLRMLLDKRLVDYVAMDVKNSPRRYGMTIGIPDFDTAGISRSISLLMNSAVDYEFRTTVVSEFHDDSVFPEIGQWIRGAKRYYLQCFVDRDTVLRPGLHAPSEADLRRYMELVRPYVQNVELRGI